MELSWKRSLLWLKMDVICTGVQASVANSPYNSGPNHRKTKPIWAALLFVVVVLNRSEQFCQNTCFHSRSPALVGAELLFSTKFLWGKTTNGAKLPIGQNQLCFGSSYTSKR